MLDGKTTHILTRKERIERPLFSLGQEVTAANDDNDMDHFTQTFRCY